MAAKRTKWEKLSPEQFHALQELMEEAVSQPISTVLEQFQTFEGTSKFGHDQPVNYDGFKSFLRLYFDRVELNEELARALFLSFCKKPIITPGTCLPTTVANIPSKSEHPLYRERSLEKASSIDSSSTGISHSRSSSKKSSSASSYSKISDVEKENVCVLEPNIEEDEECSCFDSEGNYVYLKDFACYLTLLEGRSAKDKLEFSFRLYDADSNGYLDKEEMKCIVSHMMLVAEYLGWETSELESILAEMLLDMDTDADGEISLEEWIQGGITTTPLLVLLGLDSDQTVKDGCHLWRHRHFSRPSYCNLCLSLLVGFGKHGLCCTLCKYTVHERCVQRVPASCITTYVKSKRSYQTEDGYPNEATMQHHWVEGNCPGTCDKCHKSVKVYNGINGLHCRWCQMTLHTQCVKELKPQCKLGTLRYHLLPPICIFPALLDRSQKNYISHPDITGAEQSDNQQLYDIVPLRDTRPLLVFVNPKSGGRQGEKVFRKFQYLFNPKQVYNLGKGSPYIGLKFFKDVSNFNILVCGGDGTVGWVLSCLDEMQLADPPNIALLPLGTGNDLARCLRWGGGYEWGNLNKILGEIQRAKPVVLDRWRIDFSSSLPQEIPDVTEPLDDEEKGDPPPSNIFNMYFSIGVDASIGYRFHMMREKHPEKFTSRTKNKLWYFECGTTEQFTASCKSLHEYVDILCDGVSLDIGQGTPLEGISILNIPSCYGGSNPWGGTPESGSATFPRKRHRQFLSRTIKRHDPLFMSDTSTGSTSSSEIHFAQQDMGDKMLEVVGLESTAHCAKVKAKLRTARRLAQCSGITIRTRKRFPMQIDGEPWMQIPCTIDINHHNQVNMLQAQPPPKRGLISRIFNLDMLGAGRPRTSHSDSII